MRKYYFCIDKRGLLFNDEFIKNGLRNIATALKDKTFLDVTFKMLRPLKANDYLIHNDHKYTHISPCRSEVNYIRCLDPNASLVFTSLRPRSQSQNNSREQNKDRNEEGEEDVLTYGGNLTHPFDINSLRVSDGYLYHKITHHRHLQYTYGLLHPDIAFYLTSNEQYSENENENDPVHQEKMEEDTDSVNINYKGQNHIIYDKKLEWK